MMFSSEEEEEEENSRTSSSYVISLKSESHVFLLLLHIHPYFVCSELFDYIHYYFLVRFLCRFSHWYVFILFGCCNMLCSPSCTFMLMYVCIRIVDRICVPLSFECVCVSISIFPFIHHSVLELNSCSKIDAIMFQPNWLVAVCTAHCCVHWTQCEWNEYFSHLPELQQQQTHFGNSLRCLLCTFLPSQVMELSEYIDYSYIRWNVWAASDEELINLSKMDVGLSVPLEHCQNTCNVKLIYYKQAVDWSVSCRWFDWLVHVNSTARKHSFIN